MSLFRMKRLYKKRRKIFIRFVLQPGPCGYPGCRYTGSTAPLYSHAFFIGSCIKSFEFGQFDCFHCVYTLLHMYNHDNLPIHICIVGLKNRLPSFEYDPLYIGEFYSRGKCNGLFLYFTLYSGSYDFG
jgi:hypothetical protein